MEKKRCMTLGKFNKKFFYFLLGAIIIKILEFFLLLLFQIPNPEDKNKFTILNILSYPFFLSLSESLMMIPNLILQKNIESPKKHLETKETSHSIEYIFNPNAQSITIKDKIYLFFMSLIKLLSEVLYILYHYFLRTEVNCANILNHNFKFEIIIIILLMKILSKNQYYRHHYLSIIFLILSGITYFIVEFHVKSIGTFFLHLLSHILYSFL